MPVPLRTVATVIPDFNLNILMRGVKLADCAAVCTIRIQIGIDQNVWLLLTGRRHFPACGAGGEHSFYQQ